LVLPFSKFDDFYRKTKLKNRSVSFGKLNYCTEQCIILKALTILVTQNPAVPP